MRDSERSQILEACGGVKSAADLMRFLMHVHKCRRREFPDDAADSPRMLMSFSYADLEAKTGFSERTLTRAIKLFRQRGFIRLHNKIGQTNLIELNDGAIGRWLQKMPLFESGEIDVSPYSTPDISDTQPLTPCQGSGDTVSGVPLTRCQGSSYICAPIPPSAAGEIADAATENNSDQKTAIDVQPQPEPDHQRPAEEPDAQREALIADCRAINISLEQAEHYLATHTRQKLQAALQALKIVSRKRIVRNPAGFVIGFLAHPSRYGYELDRQGAWRPASEIHKARQTIKARDRPPLHPREQHHRDCALAWQSLDYFQQQAIRNQIITNHPDKPPAVQFRLCQEAALQQKEAPCQP